MVLLNLGNKSLKIKSANEFFVSKENGKKINVVLSKNGMVIKKEVRKWEKKQKRNKQRITKGKGCLSLLRGKRWNMRFLKKKF